MRTPIDPIMTRSHLDLASVDNGILRLAGWTLRPHGAFVDTFKVFAQGIEFGDIEVWCNLSSPDVKEVFPDEEGAEQARFMIHVPLSPVQRVQLRDCLISLTPLIGEREGRHLLHIMEPTLPIPAPELNQKIGGGDFLLSSCEFLGYFIQHGGLEPSDRVLDVGCGAGRMAYALAYYLNSEGRYEGFDIMVPLVQWAAKNISARFSNFDFRYVDILNPTYNPSGLVQSCDFAFPYHRSIFDFVFLTSVFTHMRPADIQHYLDEIHRVLVDRGRCLFTCFLINEEVQRLISEGKASVNMVYEMEDFFTADPNRPEDAIGLREPDLMTWIRDRNLGVAGKFYGSWAGRANFTTFQDMLLLEKSE